MLCMKYMTGFKQSIKELRRKSHDVFGKSTNISENVMALLRRGDYNKTWKDLKNKEKREADYLSSWFLYEEDA